MNELGVKDAKDAKMTRKTQKNSQGVLNSRLIPFRVLRESFATFASWIPALLLTTTALLSACSNTPPTPDWQLNSLGAAERATAAYLSGNTKVEALEFAKARDEAARTAQPSQVARIELLRCATRVAALVLEPCAAYDKLRADTTAADKAYADYLSGQFGPADISLLPPAQRPAATAALGLQAEAAASAVQAIADPLSRLVAAGVLFKGGLASPQVIATAVDTASRQGWRRPLLAWLNVQLQRAQRAGAADEVARIQRQIGLVQGQ